MRMTTFGHSCIRLDDGGRSLVLDPGLYSDAAGALRGAEAVLVTHRHGDHLDVDALLAAARVDDGLRVWAPADVAPLLAELGDAVETVHAGGSFRAAGFSVQTFGGQHAANHWSVPVVDNIGYLVDEAVYHPGDSLVVPTAPVRTLLAPIHAPWSRTAEVLDFMLAVRAPQVHPIHDALLSDAGHQVVEAHFDRVATDFGLGYRRLAAGEGVEV